MLTVELTQDNRAMLAVTGGADGMLDKDTQLQLLQVSP